MMASLATTEERVDFLVPDLKVQPLFLYLDAHGIEFDDSKA
jgi:hypothetical protein